MMRGFALIMGIAFGYVLIMSGVSNYDVIREMFLFQSFHLYGVLMIAVGLAFIGVQIIKKLKMNSLIDGQPIDIPTHKPERDHIVGGLLCGFGWALTGACPGPALAQIGFGTLAGIFTVVGIFLGVYVYGLEKSRSA